MNIRAYVPIDKAQFFAFAETRTEGPYEYERGRVVQQTTIGTGRHASVAGRFMDVLKRELGRDDSLVTGSFRGVETEETIRQPDVVVERQPIDLDSLATTAPVIVVEVLSPSTRATDLNLKPAEYMSLAALQAYIAAEQDEAKCWLWMRDETGTFPAAPLEIASLAATVSLREPRVDIPLAEIYQGLVSS